MVYDALCDAVPDFAKTLKSEKKLILSYAMFEQEVLYNRIAEAEVQFVLVGLGLKTLHVPLSGSHIGL